jgi:hypothetical protein
MIIDVALQGDANMQKLASKAKKAAVDVEGLNVAIKASGVNLQTAKAHMDKWHKDLGKVETQVTKTNTAKFKMVQAEKKLTAAMTASAEAIKKSKNSIATLKDKYNAATKAVVDGKVALDKSKAATKAAAEEVKRLTGNLEASANVKKRAVEITKQLTAAKGKHTRLMKKEIEASEESKVTIKAQTRAEGNLAKEKAHLNSIMDKEVVTRGNLRQKVDEATAAHKKEDQTLQQLQKSVQKGKTKIVERNQKTKEWTLNEKNLRKAVAASKEGVDELSNSIKKQNKASQSASGGNKKHTRSIEGMGLAAKKTNKHFQDWHDQRIGQHGGITLFRQSLGALRNQLLVLAFATRGLRNIFNKAFESTKQMESALRGLGSVAMNTGAGMDEAKAAAIALAKDGLMTVSEAAAGLKNLLSAGFGMPQAIKIMKTLTDSAAFNRQGTLALGEAIVGATQGIKNQNSIMVDNAGITKNLSVMYKEYATSIGTTMGKLNEAQKRQAIFNGLMKEGAVFAGDALKVLDTMEGSLAKYKVTVFNAAAALGDVLKPAVTAIVKAFGDAAENIEGFFKDPDKKKEFMNGLRTAGAELGEVIGSLAVGLGALAKTFIWMIKTLPQLIHFFIAYKIINKVLLKLAKANIAKQEILTQRMIGYRVQIKRTEVGLRELANGTKQVIYAQNAQYVSHGKTMSGWKLFRFELTRIMLTYDKLLKRGKPVIVQGKLMTKIFGSQLSPTLARATQGFRALGLAVTRAGGAMKVMKMAALALGKTLLRLVAFFAVFELIMAAWNAVANWGEAEKEMRKAAAAMTRNLEKMDKAHKKTLEGIEKTSKRISPLGIDQKAMNHEVALLEEKQKQIRYMVKKHNTELDEERRQEAADRIDVLKDDYEMRLEQLGEVHRELLSKESEFTSKLASIQMGYQEGMEEYYKKSGLKDLVAAKDAINQQKELADWWAKERSKIASRSGTEAQVIDSRLQSWFEANRIKHQIALEKIEKDHSGKLLAIQKKIGALRIRQNNDTEDTIQTKWETIKANITQNIDDLKVLWAEAGAAEVKLAKTAMEDKINVIKIGMEQIVGGVGRPIAYAFTVDMKFDISDAERELEKGFAKTKNITVATDKFTELNEEVNNTWKTFMSFDHELANKSGLYETGESVNKFKDSLTAMKLKLQAVSDDPSFSTWTEDSRQKFSMHVDLLDQYLGKIDEWEKAGISLTAAELKQRIIREQHTQAIKNERAELVAATTSGERAEIAAFKLTMQMKALNKSMKLKEIKDREKATMRLADATDELHQITKELNKTQSSGKWLEKNIALLGINIKKVKDARAAITETTKAHKAWVDTASGMETQELTDAKLKLVDAETALKEAQLAAQPIAAENIMATVKAGQGLQKLAEIYGVSTLKLQEWNAAQFQQSYGGFQEGAEIKVGETQAGPAPGTTAGVTSASAGVEASQIALQDLMDSMPSASQAWGTYTTAVTANNKALQKNINAMRVLPGLFMGPLGSGLQLSALYEDQAVKMAMLESAHEEANTSMANRKGGLDEEGKALQKQRTDYVNLMKTTDDWTEKNAEISDQNLVNIDQKIASNELEFSLMDARIAKLREEQKAELENARNEDAKEAFMLKVQTWKKGIDAFAGLLGGLMKAHHSIEMEEKKFRSTLMAEETGWADEHAKKQELINIKDKEFNAKRDLENAKALAALAKMIIIEISLYAAREVAKVGGIGGAVAAMAIIAAGQIAGAAAERAIVGDAQTKYDEAVATAAADEKKLREQWDKEAAGGDDSEEAEVGARQLGGTIKAEQLAVSISPTIVISGEQVFIGQGSVTEFSLELRALMIDSAQQAIETGELDITPLGGSNLLG